MTASYPASVRNYVARVDLVDTVIADNVNSLQEEIKAVETVLGTTATNNSPLTSTWLTGFSSSVTSWTTLGDRLNNLESGLLYGVTGGPYVAVTGGSTITTSSNKALVLKTGTGSSNLFEAYSSANAIGFNLDASGTPKVGTSNVLYVNSSDYTTLISSITSGSALANTMVPLSTVVAAGDLILGSGAGTVSRLAKGSNGQALIVAAGSVVWGIPTDTTKLPLSTYTAAGDIVLGTGAGTVAKLGIGTNSQVLTSNGTTATWVTPTTSYVSQTNGTVTTAANGSGVVRNVWTSTAAPISANGNIGDIWIVYV